MTFNVTLDLLSLFSACSASVICHYVDIPHEGNTLYLMPNYGSDTNRYKNFQANQTLNVSVSGEEIPVEGRPVKDSNRVDQIVGKFKSKYGQGDVKKYYPKHDVAVEVPL